MAEISETAPSPVDRIVDGVTIAFGLAMLPVIAVCAPRVAVSLYRNAFAVSLTTEKHLAEFAASRSFSDVDEARIAAVTEKLQALIDADAWTDVAHYLADLDQSREGLRFANARVSDIALDFIRHALAVEMYNPTMCNFDIYYVVPDAELARLEAAERANPSNPYITALLAQAHIDRGWAARGGGWSHEVTEEGWRKLMWSFETAHNLLRRFDPRELGSPLYARVCFQLMVTKEAENGLAHARDAYQDWSDMDIGNPLPHRHFGFFALPRWFGNWVSFDEEARRAADRTRHATGAAAYARFYLLAIDYDGEDALEQIDVGLFTAALDDLIAYDPNGSVAALRAVVALHEILAEESMTLLHEVFCRDWLQKRMALKAVMRHVLDTHVTCLPTEEGSEFEVAALKAISFAYHKELKAGQRVRFTPEGLRMVAAERQATPR